MAVFPPLRSCRRPRDLMAVVVAFASLTSLAAIFAADWPMRGRDRSRNAVSPERNAPIDWELGDDSSVPPKPPSHVRWSARLGEQSCGDPVIARGHVWVGTDNSRPRNKAESEDASVLMCFSEKDGAFLYQYVSPRLPSQYDWPYTGLASSPLIEGDRLWFCNNRCEVVCLDIAALRLRTGQPRVVWKVDLRTQLGVVPRGVMLGSGASHCSIASYKDLIYVNTTNAFVDRKVPAPDAPSLVCFEKHTGDVRWKDKSPGNNILDVQQGAIPFRRRVAAFVLKERTRLRRHDRSDRISCEIGSCPRMVHFAGRRWSWETITWMDRIRRAFDHRRKWLVGSRLN